MSLTIDPKNMPLRGVRVIARYLQRFTDSEEQLTRRQLANGLIDGDRDGDIWISTPARIDASPLIAGSSAQRHAPKHFPRVGRVLTKTTEQPRRTKRRYIRPGIDTPLSQEPADA